jgi:hypothetical protein
MTRHANAWAAILRERRKPILVTLFALSVFVAGFHVPVPGLMRDMLTDIGNSSRFSVFALGVAAWMTVAVIAELARLALSGSRLAFLFKGPYASVYSRPVIAMALALSAFQGYGISTALPSIGYMASDAQATPLMVVSFMAGTAIIISLGRLIDHAGIGMGFWLLVAAGSIQGFAFEVLSIPGMLSSGEIGLRDVAAWALMLAVALALMTALLMLRRRNGADDIYPLLWPLLMAPMLLPLVLLPVFILPSALSDFLQSHLLFILASLGGLLVPLLVLIYAPRHQPWATTVLTLVGVGIAFVITVILGRVSPIPATLSIPALVLLAYLGVSLFDQYTDHQRKFGLKGMRTKKSM